MAGFILGLVRISLLVPSLGERWAELVEMPVMLLVIIMAAQWVPNQFGLKAKPGKCFAMGMLALLWMLAAETSLVALMQDRSISEYIMGRDPVSGSVYLLMLLVFATLPFFLSGRQFKQN